MTEFIGSRISLISKRDIRYVGTLHEISSENSTVALENVTSYGTEGRRPEEEIPPNLENVYEYIVFRGSDVKDLRIEEAPKEVKKAEPPKIPDDPAILGSTRRPNPVVGESAQPSKAPIAQSQVSPLQNSHHQIQQPEGQDRNGPLQHQYLQQQQQFQYGMPPSAQRFGPGPSPGPFPPGHPGYSGHPGHGFQGQSYGGPPGWYPPYGMPPHMQGQFPQNQMPGGQFNQFGGPRGFPPGPPQYKGVDAEQNSLSNKESSARGTPIQSAPIQAPPPPMETKPGNATIMPATGDSKLSASIPKSNRLVPAIPLSPAIKIATTTNGATKQSAPITSSKPNAANSVEDANRDARAAVAAAMAKLPPMEKRSDENGPNNANSITKGMSELRTSESRGRGRGARGANRGNRAEARPVEVPKTDFDFASSNAKFNKHDLAKEATASGSPIGTPNESLPEVADIGGQRGSDSAFTIPVISSYNKTSSFFDDISSEIKDRADITEGGNRLGGREFRSEERQKNVETFGQGSVDNFRFARGRGRGRGYGRGRGRGSYNQGARGSSNARGGRDGAATATATVEG